MTKSKFPQLARRSVLLGGAGALAAPMIWQRNAWAASKSLYISTYTGTVPGFVASKVIPDFQKDYNCTVYAKQMNTLPAITALRVQKKNPQISVAMMDDLGIPIAKQDRLLQALPTDKIPNMAKVNKNYHLGEGYGIGIAVSQIAPWYCTASLKTAPTSWKDLWDPKFVKRFSLATPKFSESVPLVAMAAAIQTGKSPLQAQYDMLNADPELTKLKPNVASIHEDCTGTVLQMTQGQLDIAGPDFSKSVVPYQMHGAPIAMMQPVEGSFAGVNAIGLVANAPEPDLGAAFINRMLEPEIQAGMASVIYAGPTVKDVKLDPAVAKLVPGTEEQQAQLMNLDWAWINPRRDQVIAMLNQIFS